MAWDKTFHRPVSMANVVAREHKLRNESLFYVELVDKDKNILTRTEITGYNLAEKIGRDIMKDEPDETRFIRIYAPEHPEMIDFITKARLVEKTNKKLFRGRKR